MAAHSSVPAWRTPQTEEPGGPQSAALQGVRRAGGLVQGGVAKASQAFEKKKALRITYLESAVLE